MMKTSPPSWYRKKEKELVATGKLDLSNQRIPDLSFVSAKSTLKHLDLSFSLISTLAGLPEQHNIDSVDLSDSTLVSFENFMSVRNATSFKIKNTPVSRNKNALLSLCVLIGPRLKIVDGKLVSDRIKAKAQEYPLIAAKLVNAGWIAEYPCPDHDELLCLCHDFGLQLDQDEDVSQNALQEQQSPLQFHEFSEIRQNYLQRHKQLHENYEHIFYKPCRENITGSEISASEVELRGEDEAHDDTQVSSVIMQQSDDRDESF